MITATSELLGKSFSKEEVRNFAAEIFDACGKKGGQKLTKEEFLQWSVESILFQAFSMLLTILVASTTTNSVDFWYRITIHVIILKKYLYKTIRDLRIP